MPNPTETQLLALARAIADGHLRINQAPWFLGVDYGRGESYTVVDEVGPVPESLFKRFHPTLPMERVDGVWQVKR